MDFSKKKHNKCLKNMLKWKKVTVQLLIYFTVKNQITNAFSFVECPLQDTHFQKTIGYKPASLSIASGHLLYSDGYERYLPPKSINPVCWKICHADISCIGYVLYFNASECYGFTNNPKNSKYEYLQNNMMLAVDVNAIYFEKICSPDLCKNKFWTITRIPRSSLIVHTSKNSSRLMSRTQCIKYCINEREFRCRSVSFIVSHKNNRNRINYMYQTSDNSLGQCILSAENKDTKPQMFNFRDSDHEYIEIDCLKEDDYCAFEQYKDSYMPYADIEYENLDLAECELKCTSSSNFTCLGYSVVNRICLIHSENLLSMGPRSIYFESGAVYMQRTSCLNVSIECNAKTLSVTYQPSETFFGKMYSYGRAYSRLCSVTGMGTNALTLSLPIGTETKESTCGITRAYHIGSFGNRTLLQTKILVQMNPELESQNDRLIKVGCIINNYDGPLPEIVSPTIHYNYLSSILPRVKFYIFDSVSQIETNSVQLGDIIELKIVMGVKKDYDIHATNLYAKSIDGRQSIDLLDFKGCPADAAIFPQIEKKVIKDSIVLYAKFAAFKFAGSSLVNFYITINFCAKDCPKILCDSSYKIISHGRRKKRNDFITYNETQINNVNENTTEWEPIRINNESINVNSTSERTEKALQENKTFNGYNPRELYVDSQQKIFSQYTYFAESTMNDTSNVKNIFKTVGEAYLHVQILVSDPENNLVIDSFIYGDNNKILVAGLNLDQPDSIQLHAPLLAAILIFWIIFNIILIVFCCWLIRKYKKDPKINYNSSSIDRFHRITQFDSLDRRGRVHWADHQLNEDILHI